MKRAIVLTGSELRHRYFRMRLAAEDGIAVVRTYCEGQEKSHAALVEKDEGDKSLRRLHLAARDQSECDFFADYVAAVPDRSNPAFVAKGAINEEAVVAEIEAARPDLLVAYGCSLVKSRLLETFAGRFLNVHLGLSPYYRGSGTNFWPLVNGEPEYVGATFMHIDPGIDTGAIIHQIRARYILGDSPATIGNRLIADMIAPYAAIVRGLDRLAPMEQPAAPDDERVYRANDFSEESVARGLRAASWRHGRRLSRRAGGARCRGSDRPPPGDCAMKAVMYHYVRPVDPRLPRLRALHIEDFRDQLDHFEREYGFVEQSAFLDAFAGGPAPTRGVVLTFDDGVKDHHDHVLPELAKRGLWGIFYVPTAPWRTGELLGVHRVHELLARFEAEAVAEALGAVLRDGDFTAETDSYFEDRTYRQQAEEAPFLWVKRMLNYSTRLPLRERLLNGLYGALLPDGGIGAEAFYCDPAEIRALHDAGMLIGCHSRSHGVMSQLSTAEQREEIATGFAELEAVVPARPRTFCYPYGGFHTFTAETEAILDALGVAFSFNVEQRDVTANDVSDRPQALPRYDCNHFPHGRARSVEAQLAAVGAPAERDVSGV